MKNSIYPILLGLVVGLAIADVPGAVAAESEKAPAEPTKTEEKPKDNPLHLPPARREAMGIQLVTPRKMTLAPEVQAFGRVLDPGPYVALLAEAATAKAALVSSEKDLERVQKLHAAGGNASAQAVETAEAAAIKDRVAVASARVRLLAGWGGPLAEMDLTAFTELLTQGAAVLRIDLLPGDTPEAGAKTATISLLGATDAYSVELLGPAPVSDPQVQGQSYLALLRGHSLPAGLTVRATLAGKGTAATAFLLPRSAIIYQQGSAWIYVLGEEDTFERKLVQVGRVVGDDVALSQGVEEADQVVSQGAQQLLSAELQTGGSADAD